MTNIREKMTGIAVAVAILALVMLGLAQVRARYAAEARVREISMQNRCRNNLRMIDDMKDQMALGLNYKAGATVTEQELSPYLKGGFSGLVCPKGGRYTIKPVGKEPECSEHGTRSAMPVKGSPVRSVTLQEEADARAAAMQLEAEREGMRIEGVMAGQIEQARQAKAKADAAKAAADAEAARLEKERQATLAADAEAARAAALLTTPAVAPAATPVPDTPYKLSAIIGAKGTYRALINGQLLKAGDKLETGRVVTIEATQVTIESTDGTTVKLQMAPNTAGRGTPGDAPALPPGLRKGLLAYYPFNKDEGGCVSDLSDCRRNATVVNVTWTPDGKVGGAMLFTPKGSRIVASDEGLPTGDAPRSIAFWKKTGPKNEVVACVLTYGAQRRDQECSLFMDWRVGRSSIGVSPNGTCNVAKTKLENDRWYHVVYCYGGNGTHTVYINGVADSFAVSEFSAFNTQLSGTLFLGDADEEAPSYDGCMDEVMIYDRVLSPDEVRQIYERQ